MSSLKYEELDGNSSFRIAILQPGTASADIKISLLRADFDRQYSYEALSYVWGNPSVTCSIFCEQQPINITINLFRALRRICYEDKPRNLWIDAICINQSDNIEREQQVSRMKDIYSHASQVIIWTGEDDTLANSAHHLAGLFLAALRNNPDIFSEDPVRRLENRNVLSSHAWFQKHSKSAIRFLGNEWFRRVWTYQEAFLSQDAIVVCGRIEFPWKPFVLSWYMIDKLGIKLPLRGMESAKTVLATCSWDFEARLSASEQENLAQNPLRLSNIMRSTYTHLASDPRDRIFGLLAMVQPRNGAQFLPDYHADVKDVYIRYAKLMIQDDGHLQILSDAQNRGHDPSLPSWVPDWQATPTGHPLAERIRIFQPRYHLHRGFDPQHVILDIEDPRKLKLRGAHIGKIREICFLDNFLRTVHPACIQPGNWKGVISHFKEFYDSPNFSILNVPQNYNPTCEPTFSAFVRTLAGDFLPSSDRVCEDEGRHYFPWCADYQSLTWRESFKPLDFDEETMGDSPYASVTGAPVQEVLDLLFHTGVPTHWSFPALSFSEKIKVATIYRHISEEILRIISGTAEGRLMYVTENGYLGLGPCGARVGDHVYDLLGGDVPFVLRDAENPNEFTFVGDTYVHGIMDGELWRLASDGNRIEPVHGAVDWEEIVLL